MFSSTFDGSDATASTSVNVPGAFSTHLPPQRTPQSSRALPRVVEKKPDVTLDTDKSTEVDAGQILAHFDISVGRLIWKLVQKLKEAMKSESPTSEPTKSEPNPTDLNLKFSAIGISLKFLERLEGTLGSMSDTAPWTEPRESDILLRTSFKGLSIETHKSQSTSKTVVDLRKFVLGYAQENIVSFDAGLQMRSSVRDLKASEGLDVSINILQTADTTRVDMKTLPLHVAIDLQRLDETFSWFGGLSSVLNLGSSIVSNATVTAASPSKSKPRSVRFETPNLIEDQPSGARSKIDVRVGGFVLDLVGQECSVGVETSAVKIAGRDTLVKVAIDKIRLSGPHLRSLNEDPAINVDIAGTRIDYLPSPTDVDLDTLLSLITPSKAKYDQDDDILLDTLLRQRKQGAVLRLAVDSFQTDIGRLDELSYLPELGEEVSRLATVSKYLPDDERPGLLSLIKVKNFDAHIAVGQSLGVIQLTARDIEVAQITLPALVALSINTVSIYRNGKEELLDAATDPELREPRARAPAIMARMIGDEMVPIVKIKLWNLKAEYQVATLIALLDLAESATSQDVSASLNASVATLTGLTRPSGPQSTIRGTETLANSQSKPMTIDVVLRDCILGLNPMGLPSKVLVVLTEAHMSAVLPKDNKASATGDMGKASLLVIDNVANITSGGGPVRPRHQSFDGGSSQVADLCATGYVSVSYISSAKAIVQMVTDEEGEKSIDIELRDDLFVLESCADSTQTLIAVLNGLAPPTPPSKEIKYRTKVIPVHDLLASLSGDAFGRAEGDYNFDDDFGLPGSGEILVGEDADDFDFDSHYYQNSDEQYNEAIVEDLEGSIASARLTVQDTNDGILLNSFVEPQEDTEEGRELEFQEDHFGTGSVLEGTAHRWNSAKNTYDKSNSSKIRKSPLKVCVRDVHIIWNLFDGYDWQHTRDTITKAVQDVESKAIERRVRNDRRPTFEQDIEDEETVIGDFLFNSIYIGIPGNRDPRELAAAINQELNDNATETESIATTS
jgi:autophagy-related protein 2